MIKQWNSLDKDFSIQDLLQKIELYRTYNYPIARQIIKKQSQWVLVLTAHGSKWLEYATVFIPGIYTGNWENKRMMDKLKLPLWIAWEWLQSKAHNQIEEDRRLFFVAITRAKNNLHLSYPAWVGTKPLLQSSFIEEITWTYKEIESSNNDISIEAIPMNKMKPNLVS